VTIDPDHASQIGNSIVTAQRVFVAVFLRDFSGGRNKEVINGNHRVEESQAGILNKLLPENFKIPAVCLTRELANSMAGALDEIQDLLNGGLPKKLNNTNDMIASMTKCVNDRNLDLSDKEQYDQLVRYFSKKYAHSPLKTVKGNATRVKRKKFLETCDVWCDTTQNFVNKFIDTHGAKKPAEKSEFYNFKIGKTKYKNCKLQVVSTKGSSYDQAFRRDCNFNHDNPDKTNVHLVACQVNKGDPQTTLKSRKSYFENMYKDWQRFGQYVPTPIGADLVVIVPQNMGSFETNIYGTGEDSIITVPENKELSANWKILTREEIYQYFASNDCNAGSPYLPEWITTEKSSSPTLTVVSE
jgi:hypothetical protein